MIRVGVCYMFEKLGMEMANDPRFWETYRISYLQLKQDSEYLDGFLKSATKAKANPFIMRHKNTRDGLLVWMAFHKTSTYGGSEKIRSNELEEMMLQTYNPKAYKGISHFIEEF